MTGKVRCHLRNGLIVRVRGEEPELVDRLRELRGDGSSGFVGPGTVKELVVSHMVEGDERTLLLGGFPRRRQHRPVFERGRRDHGYPI